MCRGLSAGAKSLGNVGGLFEDGHGFETKEIHLQQAAFFDLHHIVLGGRLVFYLTHRHVMVHGARGDNHAAGVDAEAAPQIFNAHRRVEHQATAFILLVAQAHGIDGIVFIALSAVFYPDIRELCACRWIFGDEVGQVLGFLRRPFVGAANVFNRHARFHGAQGHNLGHGFLAVFICNVIDNPLAAISKSRCRYPACFCGRG